MPFFIIAMLLLAIFWVFVEFGGPASGEELDAKAEREQKEADREEMLRYEGDYGVPHPSRPRRR